MNKNTAIGGYKEEELICNDLNENIILTEQFKNFTNNSELGFFSKIKGNFKSDISDSTNKCRIQVKKYKDKQFGQIDRHWIDSLILNIDELKNIEYILKNLCEIPLKSCGTIVDKSKGRKLLNLKNYSENELIDFINILNENKKPILEYVFKGTNINYQPNYICGVEYQKKFRKQIIIYNINDVIENLSKFDFSIKNSKSVISLNNCFTIQRKGGDCGKKSSNQIQFKLIFSLLNIKNKCKFIL
mgnify:CR=1 FL=1